MDTQWYYMELGEERGPVSSKALLDLAKRGEVSRDTPVRAELSDRWVSAERIQGLFPPPSQFEFPKAAAPRTRTQPPNTPPGTGLGQPEPVETSNDAGPVEHQEAEPAAPRDARTSPDKHEATSRAVLRNVLGVAVATAILVFGSIICYSIYASEAEKAFQKMYDEWKEQEPLERRLIYARDIDVEALGAEIRSGIAVAVAARDRKIKNARMRALGTMGAVFPKMWFPFYPNLSPGRKSAAVFGGRDAEELEDVALEVG